MQRAPLRTEQAKSFKPLRVNSLAVMPLQPTSIAPEFPPTLNDDLLNVLEQRTSLELLNHGDTQRVSDALGKVRATSGTMKEQAAHFGRTLGAQGVLYGIVTKYQDSSGTKLGAEQLAAAGFRLWLVDPASGETLWSASYENSEQPLSENLFRLGEKLKTGVGFRSAPELMKVGFNSAADELQRLREGLPPSEEKAAPSAGR